MSEPPAATAGLSPEQLNRLFEKLQAKQVSAPAEEGAIPRRAGGGRPPLSFAQERLWVLDQLQPGNPAFNVAGAAHLAGPLETSLLHRSLEATLARHDSLRTTFAVEAAGPVQVVAEPGPLGLPVVDLCNLSGDHRRRLLEGTIRAGVGRPFDLQQGPLHRMALLRLEPDEHVLLMVLHHIVADGWSAVVLVQEIAALYGAFAGGGGPGLPELPIQYADFAVWQRRWLAGDNLERQLDYWRRCLAGLPHLELPTDRPRPAVQSWSGARRQLAWSAERIGPLKAFAEGTRASLFMALLAAFQLLIHRYTGQTDFAVGAPIANRGRGEIEGLIGFFVNTLVLRADLAGEPTFRQLLARVRERTLEAYSHQDLPFEKLVEELNPERSLSHNPLVQVLFGLQNVPGRLEIEEAGLAVRFLEVDAGTSQLDLYLSLREDGSGRLKGWLEYNTDLFDPTTLERLVHHLENLLAAAPADPDRPVAALPPWTAAEGHQMLAEWNDSRRPLTGPDTVPPLFATQAARTPEAVALVHGEAALTYRGLQRRARELAGRLRELGMGPGSVVAVATGRGLELVTALLAVLEAGAAYLPLDPAYPLERLAYMLDDSGAGVLIADGEPAPELAREGREVIRLDAGPPATVSPPAGAPGGGAGGADLAYVIYTSGSTGRPKGVMVPHAGVVNFFAGMDERLGGGQADAGGPGTWLAVTSASFDISVLELLWTLTRGFRVVVVSEPTGRATPAARAARRGNRPVELSLFYFASDEAASDGGASGASDTGDLYRLLLEGARLADRHGFLAVWTPERHFHPFGGLYPNPSVTSAALAAVTERVQIRAGSVVLPLHNPVRVAEEWSVVDNLSRGRVGLSCASGWHADDFIFAPGSFGERKRIMLESIETLRRLWRGESVRLPGGAGNQVEVRIHPRPVQRELPLWITAAVNPETFRIAGEMGTGLLTHLLGQSLEEMSDKIAVYRRAWRQAGHAGEGWVTLMLHTFVGDDPERVRELVREPFKRYLGHSVGLIRNLARSLGIDPDARELSGEEMEVLLEHAFERYYETSALMGTPGFCLEMMERLAGLGVDEVGCLIDFGIAEAETLAGLERLAAVGRESRRRAAPPAEEELSLPQAILRHRVTHLQCTPSLATVLTADPQAGPALEQLDALMLGGEALPAALAQELGRHTRGAIHNLYGPTETTIWSATHRLAGRDGPVPIGRPLANTDLHLLDRRLEPVPVGAPGALYVGGAGVTRGYLGRPGLTVESFIPHPLAASPGDRLYRTGDLARRRAGGELEFLGRLDHQVKIRGYRIEPGEVAAALGELPGVREAVVVVREDTPGLRRLVAYLVTAAGAPAVPELRRSLQRRLPEHLVPAAMVPLDALPRTPNGKLDRAALPPPDGAPRQTEVAYVAPRGELEEAVASVWRELLETERVGIDDNFFEVGGNSLLLVQVHRRLQASLGAELSLVEMFRHPTVRSMAEHLSRPGGEAPSFDAVLSRTERQKEARRRRQRRQGETR